MNSKQKAENIAENIAVQIWIRVSNECDIIAYKGRLKSGRPRGVNGFFYNLADLKGREKNTKKTIVIYISQGRDKLIKYFALCDGATAADFETNFTNFERISLDALKTFLSPKL